MSIACLRNLLPRILVLTVASLLTACAGLPDHHLSAADRATVKNVSLNPAIELPKELMFHTHEQAIAPFIFYGVGIPAAKERSQRIAREIVSTMNRNNISIRAIVKTEFKRALVAVPSITLTDDNVNADAQLSLRVELVGLMHPHGVTFLLYPLMKISATMKKKDGTLIWQKSDYIAPASSENKDGYKLAEYHAQPALLRQVFSTSAAILSRNLVAELKSPR